MGHDADKKDTLFIFGAFGVRINSNSFSLTCLKFTPSKALSLHKFMKHSLFLVSVWCGTIDSNSITQTTMFLRKKLRI